MAGARRQAPDVLERADDRRAGRRGCGVGARGLVAAAVACARFVETELRRRRRGPAAHVQPRRAKRPAFLEDHAYLLEAYLALYESTFDERWFIARGGARRGDPERFFDPERGGFFSTAADHTGLIARRKDLENAPMPSGGSAAAFGLLRLAQMTGESAYEEAALSLVRAAAHRRPDHPLAFGHLLRAIDFSTGAGARGRLAGDDMSALAQVVRGGFHPHVVLAGGHRPSPAPGPGSGRRPPAAYVCERFTCRLPVSGVEELEASLRHP